MIEVTLFQKGGSLTGFLFSGHAGAGEYGYDIVCSAVSALAINTANAIETFTDVPLEEEAAEDVGYLRCMLGDADDRDAQLLMRALELGIRQLAQSYPENIRIHCETPA